MKEERTTYRKDTGYLMTDYGHFMVWCYDNHRQPTPKNFTEFAKMKVKEN